MSLSRTLRIALSALLLLIASLAALAYLLAWHPAARETLTPVCRTPAPQLQPGQALKVMTWNVQYLAGKRYVFWDDLPDAVGPDEKPTAEDIAYTLDEVVRVVREEAPDVLLLQDVDAGAAATGHQDQQALLAERLADLYPCSAQTFDWKSRFNPNPHVFGSVGRKLVTFSRFQIARAERLSLLHHEGIPLARLFARQPALLLSELPIRDGKPLTLLNTRLQRPRSKAGDHPAQQIGVLEDHLARLQASGAPWLLGGDFGLLPLGQYPYLPDVLRRPYRANSELNLLTARYPMVPSLPEASGTDQQRWYTYFPNDPRVKGPDRTLDYLFHSPSLSRLDAAVRSEDTLRISNHLPLSGRFLLPH